MKPVSSPRELAQAIGVSESSIKRWIDDGVIQASRTAGGHRRIPAPEIVRFIRESKSPLLRPEILGLEEVSAISGKSPASGEEADALFRFLRDGASSEAIGLLMSLYLGGRSMAQIIDGPLRIAMERVGELWLSEPSGLFWEHRATQIAIQAVSRLRWILSPPARSPIAVGGAPAGDPYQLPSLCVAAVMEAQGLEAVNLGPDTPLESLAIAAESLDASIVWLSLSGNGKALETLERDLGPFLDRLARRSVPLVVGGNKLEGLDTPSGDLIYRGSSMAELEALLKGMRVRSRVATDASASEESTAAEAEAR
jgi:excisionase family DNA binding protein